VHASCGEYSDLLVLVQAHIAQKKLENSQTSCKSQLGSISSYILELEV